MPYVMKWVPHAEGEESSGNEPAAMTMADGATTGAAAQRGKQRGQGTAYANDSAPRPSGE